MTGKPQRRPGTKSETYIFRKEEIEIFRNATWRNVSSDVGPWGTGIDLRPSSSTRTPEWLTKAMKWWKTGSFEWAFVWPSSATCSWLPVNSLSVSSSFPLSSTDKGRAFSKYLPNTPSEEIEILFGINCKLLEICYLGVCIIWQLLFVVGQTVHQGNSSACVMDNLLHKE